MTKELSSIDRKRWIKEMLAIGALLVGLLSLFGSRLATFFQRAAGTAQNSVRDFLPLEVEIERARGLVTSLVPVIRRNHEVIVREQVEIEGLRVSIATTKEELQGQREKIKALRDELSPGLLANLPVAERDDARRKLRHYFTLYQSTEAALSARQELVRSREASLAAAQAAQTEALRKKRELESEVLGFEARLVALRAQDRGNGVPSDIAKFSQAEEVLRYIRKRLTIAERLAQSPEDVASLTVDNESSEDSIEFEVDRYFVGEGARGE